MFLVPCRVFKRSTGGDSTLPVRILTGILSGKKINMTGDKFDG